ncbi:MAG: 2-oxoacid:ferredoxin oxidoreductase subunit beta [Candidatus Helarchaeota archaeon]|nr:2-oxoacid:ferredoxin oxidoreductase subunit beta [Candidatus Helarchaeota archaeon]
MVKTAQELREKYLRKDLLPTVFCPGCGNGQVLNYVIRAIDDLNISQEDLVFVSGIGCSSRLPAYIVASGIHTTHGRAIAFASGIKLTNPKLTVIVFTGDGDLSAIGLNHFLQAIRRNVNITVICINNENYGMTGGQVSPTTPMGDYSTTTPYQNIEHSFNLSFLAKTAGAVYVARWTTAHSVQAINSIKKGIQKQGLAFIEILSSCPVSRKRFRTPRDYLKYFSDETIRYSPGVKNKTSAHVFENLNACFTADCDGKIIIGEIADLEKPDFHQLYNELKERAKIEFWKKRNK